MIKSYSWVALALLVCAFLNLATVRKRQDPIASAQTGPISLQQKLEETKDGPKGAPSPSLQFYKGGSFLTKTPMETPKEAAAGNSEAIEGLDAASASDEEAGFFEEEREGQSARSYAAEEDEEEWWSEEDEETAGPAGQSEE
jgi:hypothetical protein